MGGVEEGVGMEGVVGMVEKEVGEGMVGKGEVWIGEGGVKGRGW